MAERPSWLQELGLMNEQKEKMGKRLGALPSYDAPEPFETRVNNGNVNLPNDVPDLADTMDDTEGVTENPKPNGVTVDDTADVSDNEAMSDSMPSSSPSAAQVQKLNEITAKELVKNYSVFVNGLSLEGFEWKNKDNATNLINQRAALRLHLREKATETMPDEQIAIHKRIDEITTILEKFKDQRDYLDESTKLTPEKQEEAARLLAEIWKVKQIEVSPWWGLIIIACAPIVNALLIIFLDGKRFKLGGA